MESPILGGGYVGRSTDLIDNKSINLYLELVEGKDGKSPGGLFGVSGLTLLTSIGTGPIRGVFAASNNLLYVCSGNTVYEVTSAWAATAIGSVQTFFGPVQFVDNGLQLLVSDASTAWCYTFRTLSSGPNTSAAAGTWVNALPGLSPNNIGVVPTVLSFQDGFGIVNKTGTNQWYQSNLNDLSTWQALNFSSADSTPGVIVSMYDLHREVWLFKTDRIEVWVNAGLNGFVFQRLQGVQIPMGCAAAYSVSHIDDSMVWLGADDQGGGVVYMSNGYQAMRISTHAIENKIASFATIDDAIAYVYQWKGHKFYVLTFPSGNWTCCFDLTTKLWHERAAFSNGMFSRHIGNCHAYIYNTHIVGDFQNGNLYMYDDSNFTDNGAVRKWVRSWRAFPPNKRIYDPVRFESLQVDLDTGINIPPNDNPQYMLRWSDDGGKNWSSEYWTDGNKTGYTGTRVIWQRIGSTKRGDGTDRIFEISGTDPVPVMLLAADLEAS